MKVDHYGGTCTVIFLPRLPHRDTPKRVRFTMNVISKIRHDDEPTTQETMKGSEKNVWKEIIKTEIHMLEKSTLPRWQTN